MSSWFENDEFWVRFAPVMFDGNRWAGSARETNGAMKLTGTQSGSYILDSCCGVGRHAMEFARLGCHVTGIDRTAPYIEAARESTNAEGLSVEYLIDDVRNFVRPGAYNLAVNMFTSFGFFNNYEDELLYVSHIYQSLKPGGHFLVDVNGKEILARDFFESEAWEKDGHLVYTEYRIEDNWNTLHNRWMIIDPDGKRFDYSFSHRLYSAQELSGLLRECGFSSIEIFGSFDGKAYNDKADRLIIIGHKQD